MQKFLYPKVASGILKKLLQLRDSQKAFDNNMFELEPDALLRKNTLKVVNLLAEFKKNRKKIGDLSDHLITNLGLLSNFPKNLKYLSKYEETDGFENYKQGVEKTEEFIDILNRSRSLTRGIPQKLIKSFLVPDLDSLLKKISKIKQVIEGLIEADTALRDLLDVSTYNTGQLKNRLESLRDIVSELSAARCSSGWAASYLSIEDDQKLADLEKLASLNALITKSLQTLKNLEGM